ncbi:hypothetical protein GCK72_003820 [Caenorhabditis remanei]|uniref:Uncharacterized protein n=1 Tax=Caenorhabditis remanei TaxID=31234 RepID=A0A6A5HAL6_CAERE|nr:hypothetical protein GCK72_003820 [Caenorhabditis remanei]KAF1763874.1 hypothetical protein GCK72_003820 [Caenorhabditis remanei]
MSASSQCECSILASPLLIQSVIRIRSRIDIHNSHFCIIGKRGTALEDTLHGDSLLTHGNGHSCQQEHGENPLHLADLEIVKGTVAEEGLR